MYRKVAIEPPLAPYVEQILVQEPAAMSPVEAYSVLPRPFHVLGFQYRGRLEVIRAERAAALALSGISGLQHSVRYFRARPDTRSVLAVLKPFAGYVLLGHSMAQVIDSHLAIDNFVTRVKAAEVEERLAQAEDIDAISAVVQGFLIGLLRAGRAPHPAVIRASGRILAEHGSERIGAIVDDLRMSARQIERLFREQVGIGPKQLSELARFDWVAARLARRRSLSDLALEAGYTDQAHFTRKFSAHAGVSPTRLQGLVLQPPTLP